MRQQVRELANKTGLDFTEQIAELEERYDQVGDLLSMLTLHSGCPEAGVNVPFRGGDVIS